MNRDLDRAVYWHRELAPFGATPLSEHTLEATSGRVPGTLSHRDELWDRCYCELMTAASTRLFQEIARLKGQYAHVHDESIETRRDEAKGEAWLHGRFTYMLYGLSPAADMRTDTVDPRSAAGRDRSTASPCTPGGDPT